MPNEQVTSTIELGVLSCIHNTDDIVKLKAANIKPDDFKVYGDVYEFILEFHKRYQTIPSTQVLVGRWPELELVKSDHALGYYIDLLLDHTMYLAAQQTLVKHIPKLMVTPADTIAAIAEELRNCIRMPFDAVSFTDGNALERAEEYLERQLIVGQKGLVGIATGFGTLDALFGGWRPGMLVGIIGRPKLGKSWLLLYVGCVAYRQGYRILFLSPEMPVEEVNARWDTLMGGFSNTGLNQGRDVNIKQYRKFLADAAKRKDWVTASCDEGKPFSVPVIEAYIKKYRPDLVCVDGVPLLHDVEGAEQSWMKMYNIAYGLKRVAISCNVPIVLTSQAGRQAAVTKLPRLSDIVLGDAVGQACDYVISMALPQGDPKFRQVGVQAARRSGVAKPFVITFDVNRGEIGEKSRVFDEALALLGD